MLFVNDPKEEVDVCCDEFCGDDPCCHCCWSNFNSQVEHHYLDDYCERCGVSWEIGEAEGQ